MEGGPWKEGCEANENVRDSIRTRVPQQSRPTTVLLTPTLERRCSVGIFKTDSMPLVRFRSADVFSADQYTHEV